MVLLRECWWWCISMCRCSCWGNAEDGKRMLMLMQFNVQMGMLRQHWWWCTFVWRCSCWGNVDDDAVLCADGDVETALMMMHFYVKMQLLRQCWWWYSSIWRCNCWDSADVKICLLRECWWRLPVIRCGSGGRRRWRPCNWRWSWRLSSGFAWRRGWRRRLRRRKRSGRRRRRRWMMLWCSFLRVCDVGACHPSSWPSPFVPGLKACLTSVVSNCRFECICIYMGTSPSVGTFTCGHISIFWAHFIRAQLCVCVCVCVCVYYFSHGHILDFSLSI